MNAKTNIIPLRAPRNKAMSCVPQTPDSEPLQLVALVQSLPALMGDAADLILSEFDYENNMQSNMAVAVRILAVASRRLSCSLGKIGDVG